MKNKKGKFFVFEGIDGSGKSTQSNLVAAFLKKKGYKIQKIDFPQYGKKSAGLVENYLQGKYGKSEEVGPYLASVFYACDRYDLGFQIRKWLDEGNIVISDRYVSSNVGHQGGKLVHKGKQWDKYITWLFELEYGLFGIPKPDYTFILKTSPEFSKKLSNKITDDDKKQKRVAYLGNSKKHDIHERDKQHLADSLQSYLKAAKKFPKDFTVIECIEKGKLLPIEEVHQKIISAVQKVI
jgi:dTMP kinase